MNVWIKIAGIVFVIVAGMAIPSKSAEASDYVGVREITAYSQERQKELPVTVWYPADAGGKLVTLGESEFFVGTDAMDDAPISRGKYPLVLLSHGAGLGGTPQAMSWIAAPLAKQGFIVAAPVHFGNGGTYRSAEETMKVWLRPADISATVDALQIQPLFHDHLVPGKTGVLGLSMGGNTALALAGGRFDPARLASYCDNDALNASLCGWVRQSNVNLHGMDMKIADRDNQDKRIIFSMAIDPAPVDVFKAASFSNVAIPVEIINLGQPGAIPLTALASGIAKAIPESRYSLIEKATHFSMFGVCKPGGAKLALSEDIDEPICSDGDGLSRLLIHRELIGMVIDAFNRRLKGYP